ncbi:MAG: hypothetical protein FJ104_02775 [Deltaproteobacteria bacterium]|nr:hypothetical protein [Deltaproteobacteria bacterium]
MNRPPSRSPRRLLLAALLASGGALADPAPPGWDPGRETTARFPRGVQGDPALVDADGVYGRMDGLLSLGLHGGAELAEPGPRLALRGEAHWFWVAGIYAAYSGAAGGDDPSARRAAIGVDLRPAFVPRFASGLERGPALVDLVVDSIALSLGGFAASPREGRGAAARGLEAGLGMGVPLLAAARGPWLGVRGQLRLGDPGSGRRPDPETSLLLTLGFETIALR